MRKRSAAAVLAATAVAGCGTAASAPPSAQRAAVPAACARAVRGEERAVARRVYREVASGRGVATAVRRLARSRALAAAVARDDAAATAAALRPLLRNQIKRIEVRRGGRLLASLGAHRALAPVHGSIRDAAGAVVGGYTLSTGTDAAVGALIHSLTGASVTLRSHGHAGASGFTGTAYPSGPLAVRLHPAAVPAADCAATRPATVLRAVGRIGERLAWDEAHGGAAARALRYAEADRRFVSAVAHDDPAGVRAEIIRFFDDPKLHAVRVRAVDAHGRLVNDVGGPFVLAPAGAPLRIAGRPAGRLTLSIQDDTGFIKLMREFTGARVLMLAPNGVVPGSSGLRPGARTFTFVTRAFPAGPLRITLSRRPWSSPF